MAAMEGMVMSSTSNASTEEAKPAPNPEPANPVAKPAAKPKPAKAEAKPKPAEGESIRSKSWCDVTDLLKKK